MEADRRIRKVDIGLLINLLTLGGLLWAFYAHPAKWDQAVTDLAELKPKVEDHGKQLAAIDAQYKDIKEELQAIDRKLGR